MSSARPPTDQQRTAVYDPEREPRGRAARVEIGTPTEVSPPGHEPGAAEQPASAAGASPRIPASAEQPASVTDASPRMTASAERSEPIRVFSMKAPGEGERPVQEPKQHQARIRSLSEVSPQRRTAATPPGGLGYLAPPRDPREARTRKRRDLLLWGSVAVIVAGAVTLGVWFLAGM